MRQYIRKVFYLLGDDKRKLPFIFLLFLCSALLDLLGLSLIAPYIALVMSPQTIDGTFGQVLDLAGLPKDQEFLLYFVGSVLIILFLLKGVTVIFINYVIINFNQNIIYAFAVYCSHQMFNC